MAHEPYSLIEDRPTLWPHQPAEKLLSARIDDRLRQATACVHSDRQRAGMLAEQALLLARGDTDAGALARCLYYVANLMRHVGQPTRAYVLCLEAQPMLERQDERWRATKVLQLRGRCCLGVGEHERAQTLFTDAAERFARMPDMTEVARCRSFIAVAHLHSGDLDAAVEWAARAVHTASEGDAVPIQLLLRNNEAFLRLQLGNRLRADGDAAAARLEYARAFEVMPDVAAIDVADWHTLGATLLDTMAGVALAHGDTELVRRALIKLVVWSRRWRNPGEQGLAWTRLAEFHRTRGRRRAAIACARRAVDRLVSEPRDPVLPSALLLLADLLEEEGDAPGAYQAYLAATRVEAEQQRRSIALRAELLALDSEAERALRETEQTLAYAQRMSNVGHMVASINHELNQPMASIRMLAETALELIQRGEQTEAASSIRSMLKLSTGLNALASKLAAFPMQPEARMHDVTLAGAVDEALTILRSRLAQTPYAISLQLGDHVVRAHEGQLVRVIANLLNNALDVLAGHAAPRIEFVASCAATPLPEAPHGIVTLRISDNGPGLSDAARDRLFQPFFSTKAAGQGLGLGLALSRDVMRAMGGELVVVHPAQDMPAAAATAVSAGSARVGALRHGAVFELWLPRAAC